MMRIWWIVYPGEAVVYAIYDTFLQSVLLSTSYMQTSKYSTNQIWEFAG